MKYICKFCWLFVGVLFIFSGLIKINDPVGTAIKLEEYFEVFSEDIGSFFLIFKPYALFLSVLLNTLEIVLGVALLLRWQLKNVLIALVTIIVFFTFLTFYSAYFNKVTDCGCFGDAIKLTPWQSFTKDIILLVFIVPIFWQRKKIRPMLARGADNVVMLVSTLAATAFTLYCYLHLPVIDFRPYKVGTNL